eukprot:m.488136 g.488136  ORF g.488136 m.488136 type:complete len:519 (-) comp25565_c0_seq1:245-1801(-)
MSEEQPPADSQAATPSHCADPGPGRHGRIGVGSKRIRFTAPGAESLHKLHSTPPMTADEHPPLTAAEEAIERQRLRVLFDRLDSDNDGHLTPLDLQRELERLRLPFTQSQINTILCSNRSGGGHLDFEAFYSYCIERERALREVFDALDHHGDGLLHPEEIRLSLEALGFHVDQSEIRRMMRRMHRSGTDVVDWESFREVLVLFPSAHVKDIFRYWQNAAVDMDGCAIPSDIDPEETLIPGRWWKHLTAGAVAGAVSRTFTAPLDRLKVIFQAHAAERRVSIFAGFRDLVKEGGIRSLWRGNGINVLKIAPESGIKFFIFDRIKSVLQPDPNQPTTVPQRLVAGSTAGLLAQFSIFPGEVLKTRLATATTGQYRGIAHCARDVLRHEGVRGFYKGLVPSTLGVIPYAGIDLAVYETLKQTYIREYPDKEPSVMVLLTCGAVSSSCGQLASYPLALLKTRLQVRRDKASMVEEFRAVVRHGGVTALYRGIGPNFLKVVPAVSICYVVYERTKTLLGLPC